ncbi:MAG: nuclear transport factor 2 family protein [Rhodospirillaceae bacterium]
MLALKEGSPEADAFSIVYGVYLAFEEGRTQDIEAVQLSTYSVWDALTPGLRMSLEEVKKFHSEDQSHKISRGALSWRLVPLKVDILDCIAVVLSQLDLKYEPPNPINSRLRVTDVLKRVDGSWMMFHHHESIQPISDL